MTWWLQNKIMNLHGSLATTSALTSSLKMNGLEREFTCSTASCEVYSNQLIRWTKLSPNKSSTGRQQAWSTRHSSAIKQFHRQKQQLGLPRISGWLSLTCKTDTLCRWNRASHNSRGFILIKLGTISTEAPLARAVNNSTTDGSNVKGEAMNTVSSGAILNASLKKNKTHTETILRHYIDSSLETEAGANSQSAPCISCNNGVASTHESSWSMLPLSSSATEDYFAAHLLNCQCMAYCWLEHITPILRELHRLPVSLCVQFKVLDLTYNVLHRQGSWMTTFSVMCLPSH